MPPTVAGDDQSGGSLPPVESCACMRAFDPEKVSAPSSQRANYLVGTEWSLRPAISEPVSAISYAVLDHHICSESRIHETSRTSLSLRISRERGYAIPHGHPQIHSKRSKMHLYCRKCFYLLDLGVPNRGWAWQRSCSCRIGGMRLLRRHSEVAVRGRSL